MPANCGRRDIADMSDQQKHSGDQGEAEEMEVEGEDGARDMAAESVLQVWGIHRAREVDSAAASAANEPLPPRVKLPSTAAGS